MGFYIFPFINRQKQITNILNNDFVLFSPYKINEYSYFFSQGSSKSKILLSLPSDFDGQIPSSSCMVVTIRKEKSCRNKILCSNEVVALKVFRGITKSENNSVQIDMALKEALELNVRYQFDIVLNNGWCSEGATNASWIKDGDLFTSFEQQFKNGTSAKNIVEKIRVFKDDDQKSGKICELFSLVVLNYATVSLPNC